MTKIIDVPDKDIKLKQKGNHKLRYNRRKKIPDICDECDYKKHSIRFQRKEFIRNKKRRAERKRKRQSIIDEFYDHQIDFFGYKMQTILLFINILFPPSFFGTLYLMIRRGPEHERIY